MEAPPLGTRPCALVLTGGAAFGAWQAGALCRLSEAGLSFASVFGTSAGAVNGAAYFQGRLGELRERWRSIRRSDVMRLSPRLSPPSLLSLPRLRGFLSGVVDEERARREGRCPLFVVAGDLASGGMYQAGFAPGGDGWDAPLLDMLVASCAIPLLYPPVRLRAGGRERLLVDGGLRAFADLRPALELGCRDFLFLSVVPRADGAAPPRGLKAYLSALAFQLIHGQVENTVHALRARAEADGAGGPLRAYVLVPSRPLTRLSGLDFSPSACAEALAVGESDAEAFLKNPETARQI